MKLTTCVLLILMPMQAVADAGRVHDLVVARLGYMEAVAIWKWHAGAAVEDTAREAVVLDQSVAQAVERGLPEQGVARFFAAQIAAAKAVQFCWIDRFRTGAATPRSDPPDLVAVVRPALLTLGEQITDALAQHVDDPGLGDTDGLRRAARSLECLDDWHLARLAESLAAISRP